MIFKELEKNLSDLVSGVLAYGSAEAAAASRDDDKESSNKKKGKLSTFLRDLAVFLAIPHDKSKPILTSYLAGKKNT